MTYIPSRFTILGFDKNGIRQPLFTWTGEPAAGIARAKHDAIEHDRDDLTGFMAEPMLAGIKADASEAELVGIYNQWLACNAHLEKHHDTSAEALLHENVTDREREWLSGFILIWQRNVD